MAKLRLLPFDNIRNEIPKSDFLKEIFIFIHTNFNLRIRNKIP